MDRDNSAATTRLEQALSDGISELLNLVGKKDLYDFLGLDAAVVRRCDLYGDA